MPLSRDEVEGIAHLARLEIDAHAVPEFVGNLSRIIDFVRQLDQADTDSVTPMAHPLDTPQRLRADVADEPDVRDRAQQNAPRVEAGLYLVPRVIE